MNSECIGLVLCSNSAQPIPSTRIAILNMIPHMKSYGLRPIVLFEPSTPNETPDLKGVAERALAYGCKVVLIQKVRGTSAVKFVHQLANSGVHSVYVVCDLVDVQMAQATDATIVVTDFLKSLYPLTLQSRIHVVHDGIERAQSYKTSRNALIGSRQKPLKAILVTSSSIDCLPVLGHPPPWLKIRIVGRYGRGIRHWRERHWLWSAKTPTERMEFLSFLVDRHIQCIPWSPEGVYEEMHQSDIAVIPIDTSSSSNGSGMPPGWKVKSENRLTMQMSMGLPVIATPIPSYEPVIEHGVNGFFASSRGDWNTCLTALRDPELRTQMGQAARATVLHRYSMHTQAIGLLKVLKQVSNSTVGGDLPKRKYQFEATSNHRFTNISLAP